MLLIPYIPTFSKGRIYETYSVFIENIDTNEVQAEIWNIYITVEKDRIVDTKYDVTTLIYIPLPSLKEIKKRIEELGFRTPYLLLDEENDIILRQSLPMEPPPNLNRFEMEVYRILDSWGYVEKLPPSLRADFVLVTPQGKVFIVEAKSTSTEVAEGLIQLEVAMKTFVEYGARVDGGILAVNSDKKKLKEGTSHGLLIKYCMEHGIYILLVPERKLLRYTTLQTRIRPISED